MIWHLYCFDKAMIEYLMNTYGFDKETSYNINRQYCLFVLKMDSDLSIDNFVKVLLAEDFFKQFHSISSIIRK